MVRDFDLKLKVTILALGFTTQKELHRHFLEIAPGLGLEQDNLYKWIQGRSMPRSSKVYEHWAAMIRLDRPLARLKSCSIDEFVDDMAEPYGLDRAVVASVLGRRPTQSVAGPASPDAPAEARRNQLCGTFGLYSRAFSPIFRGKIMRGALIISATDPLAPLDVSYVETTPFTVLTHHGRLAWNHRLIALDLHDEQNDSHLHLTLHGPGNPASVLAGLMIGPSFHDATPQPTGTRALAIRVPTLDLEALGGRDCVFDLAEHSISEELAHTGLTIGASAELDRLIAAFFDGGGRGGFDQISVDESARLNFALDRQLARAAARPERAGGASPAGGSVIVPFSRR